MTALTQCPRCQARWVLGDAYCRQCGYVAAAYPAARAASSDEAKDFGAGIPAMGIAIASFGLGVGASAAVGAILSSLGHPGGDAATFGLTELALWAGLLAGVFFVSQRRGTGRLRDDFGWRISRADIGMGVLGGVVGRSTTVIVAIPLYGAFHNLLRDPHVGVPLHNIDAGVLAVYAVAACIGAPMVEELFFRGLIQTRLVGRYGPVRGILVTAVLFGAAHLIGWQGAASLLTATAIAAGGLVLGFLRHRTGRLGTSIVAHGVFNSVVIVLLAVGVSS